MMNYPHLFEPIRIGDTLFRNRVFSSPTGHPDVSLEGIFTDDVIAYYERKAKGGAAAVTLGEAIVDSRYGKRHPYQLSLDTRNSKFSLAKLADKIRRYGAVPSMELQHSGLKMGMGIDTPVFGKGSEVAYGPSACEFEGHRVLEMPEDMILYIIEKFADAAQFVKGCGFGMVTVHGGHGWLINQFMSPNVNRRTDKWGGSTENRARLAIAICDAIHARCGAGFPVELRISASEVVEGGYTVEEGAAFARLLEGHADLIHCSVGCGLFLPEGNRTFSITHPCMFKEDGVNVKYAAAVKQSLSRTPVATVGALSDPAMMEEIIASGKADVVELARGLICDPDLPEKARTGREDEIVKCMRCFNCFTNGMNRGAFWCALNPVTNRERWLARDVIPAPKPQKVLVVGGGIGGMQAALTAAEQGHSVILCEKGDRLGGHIRCEEKVPFKKHLAEYIAQQERRIAASPAIEVRLNTAVTPEYARSLGADAVIAALGAVPVKPAIPGIEGAGVLCANDAFAAPEKVGQRVVVLGGGFVGLELAIYLHSLGREVTVVEQAEAPNTASNMLHGQAVTIKLSEEKLPLLLSTRAEEITPAGVVCTGSEGRSILPADTVVYAVGQRALYEETAALYDAAPLFFPVGDCVRPRNIAEANAEARSAALGLGR